MPALTYVTAFFLGVRHCFEPDHLTAIAQITSASPSPRHGLRAGLLWGLGHGLSVLVLGVALSAVWSQLSHVDTHAERAVGLTLIALSLWRLWDRHSRHEHTHEHSDGIVHSHPHAHGGAHGHWHAPTLTGLVHGAAGAVGVAVLLSLAAPGAVAAAAAAFSLGALLAMGVAGWLAAHFQARAAARGWGPRLTQVTAAWGLLLGLFWLVSA
jgi:hypothetical protein